MSMIRNYHRNHRPRRRRLTHHPPLHYRPRRSLHRGVVADVYCRW